MRLFEMLKVTIVIKINWLIIIQYYKKMYANKQIFQDSYATNQNYTSKHEEIIILRLNL